MLVMVTLTVGGNILTLRYAILIVVDHVWEEEGLAVRVLKEHQISTQENCFRCLDYFFCTGRDQINCRIGAKN